MSFCYLLNSLADLPPLYLAAVWAGLAIGTFWNSRLAAGVAVGIGACTSLLMPLGDLAKLTELGSPFHPKQNPLGELLLSVDLSSIASTELLLLLIQPGLWAGLRGAAARHYLAASQTDRSKPVAQRSEDSRVLQRYVEPKL